MNLLWLYLAISLVFNILLFLIAYKKQSDKLTDASYALTFIILAATAFFLHDKTPYAIVLLAMIILWAVRIGGFLLYRVIKAGKDARFDEMRSSFFKFSQFWILQAVTVWVVLLSSLLAFSAGQAPAIPYGAVALFLVALAIETVADLQKLRFSHDPAMKGKWIESGLWRYSRHPNYFGEILVWVALYLYALAALGGLPAILGLASPIFIAVLLVFVSGVPLLEKSADKRWGHLKGYREYKRRTSVLVLWPRGK